MKKPIYVLAWLLVFSLALIAFTACAGDSQGSEDISATATEEGAGSGTDDVPTTTDGSDDPSASTTDEGTKAPDFGLDDISSDGNTDHDNDQNWTDNY